MGAGAAGGGGKSAAWAKAANVTSAAVISSNLLIRRPSIQFAVDNVSQSGLRALSPKGHMLEK